MVKFLMQDVVETAERLLNVNDVTTVGVLLVVIFISWFVIYKIWQANTKLNLEIRGFVEKYYVLSTKILSHLSNGKDV